MCCRKNQKSNLKNLSKVKSALRKIQGQNDLENTIKYLTDSGLTIKTVAYIFQSPTCK